MPHKTIDFGDLLPLFTGDEFWEQYLKKQHKGKFKVRIHLAIFVEPYLQFILNGTKTIESRFSINRCPPYKTIEDGDIVLLKKSGGPILGICHVSSAWFYKIDEKSWHTIRKEFSEALCAQDPEFWTKRQNASYATLIKINNVRAIAPMEFYKRDRRGWVVIKDNGKQLELEMK